MSKFFDETMQGLLETDKIEYQNKQEKEMSSDKVAELLVQLYAEYERRTLNNGYARVNPNYAKAVAIAIRMLTD